MSSLDKLLKFVNSKNVAEFLDDEKLSQIAKDVILGYDIDKDSMKYWLEANQEAMKIIKNAANDPSDPDKNFPFYKASKVIYPLISPAVIQLASRLIQHLVRNNKVAECTVLGEDPQGLKAARAKRVSDFLSYEFLVESDTWLTDQHRLCHILAAWGMAFKKVYYNPATKENCSELLSPEDVIINNNTTSLDKCRRITIRRYLMKNDIQENVRSGHFIDRDLYTISQNNFDNQTQENDSREKQPVYEFLEQFCYLDLDDDGYEEPYCVLVNKQSQQVFCIYPAFEYKDLNIDQQSGEIISITPRNYLVDYHLIDDPEGKFYSLGLNQLLLHQNKSITAVLRQLLDAGILANTAASTGFVTKAFNTKARALQVNLGEFKVLDVNPNVDLSKQIMNLPFKEPSQTLLQLLEVLIQSGKETGFITDLLTGDVQGQNVPATTMLAMVEQGTRAFKPVVQKLFQSLKREFKFWFHLHSLYLDQTKYFNFEDSQNQQVMQQDFNEEDLDIVPVADPTMSSEAHKYARLQALMQVLNTPVAQAVNPQEALLRFFTELEFDNPQALIAQPQPQQPDPKLIQIQVDAQLKQKDQEIEQLKQQLMFEKIKVEHRKVDLKQQEVLIKAGESSDKKAKMAADAHKDLSEVAIQHQMADINRYNAETERERVNILEKQSRNPKGSDSNSKSD